MNTAGSVKMKKNRKPADETEGGEARYVSEIRDMSEHRINEDEFEKF